MKHLVLRLPVCPRRLFRVKCFYSSPGVAFCVLSLQGSSRDTSWQRDTRRLLCVCFSRSVWSHTHTHTRSNSTHTLTCYEPLKTLQPSFTGLMFQSSELMQQVQHNYMHTQISLSLSLCSLPTSLSPLLPQHVFARKETESAVFLLCVCALVGIM